MLGGKREVRVGEAEWGYRMLIPETVRIEVQVDMPFQIGGGHD